MFESPFHRAAVETLVRAGGVGLLTLVAIQAALGRFTVTSIDVPLTRIGVLSFVVLVWLETIDVPNGARDLAGVLYSIGWDEGGSRH